MGAAPAAAAAAAAASTTSSQLFLSTCADLKSLKRCLNVAARFGCELLSFVSSSSSSSDSGGSSASAQSLLRSPLAGALFPLLTDTVGEELVDALSVAFEPVVADRHLYDSLVYKRALNILAPIIQNAGSFQVIEKRTARITCLIGFHFLEATV